MLPIFLKILPFFLLIGLGYISAATRFFSKEAAVALTRFVFWFALSAMLFTFLMVLSVDLLIFGSLVVAVITGSRGKLEPAIVLTIGKGLLTNPMVMSIAAGLLWSLADLPMPVPMGEFMTILGAAATPAALFAIGASLAGKSAERPSVALWISSLKLVLHPLLVAIFALYLFDLDPFLSAMMIAAAAMPVAGNIYIIAQHYDVAPQRVSSAILFSTILSVLTLTAVLGWVG